MLNRVILMGRLVADPELKTTNTGVSVTSFRIAVDRSYVKAGAERQADFFDIVAWRSLAEFVCRNFSKGSLVAVDGQLQSRNYQTKEGQNRTAIEVVADNISFTGERRDAQYNNEPQVSVPQNQYQQHTDPRVYPTTGQAPAPQYQNTAQYGQPPQYQQQYAQGAAYDPRYQQGMFSDQPLPNSGDLPF